MSTPTAISPLSTRAMRLAAGGLVLALAGGFAAIAAAQPHGGHHGGHHAMAMGGGPMMMKGRMLERMLDGVNASDAQRAQIRQIVEAARAQAQGQREQHRALREQALRVFTQPNIDANAAEGLRQQMLALHDQASKRHLQTMLDIGRVLTPEQRAQIAQRISERREMMQRHQRERQQLQGQQRR
jgi:protein CpxP